ncbi:MAG: M28 family peptidase [Planctomycetales bacterium]|nr:M28 family peptidase [Planctomycetales bacterium]
MKKPDRQSLFLGAVILCAGLAIAYVVITGSVSSPRPVIQVAADGGPRSLEEIPFDGQQAYEYLKQICDLGPRPSGSPGMQQQQQMLQEHFEQLGGKVRFQKTSIRHPDDGSAVEIANLIVEWHPDRPNRVLLCAHYDTRPYPDSDPDPKNRKGVFVGANDGASGVAVLMQLGTAMPALTGQYGVDFVLFDAEEFIFNDRRDSYFVGSEYFARDYVQNPPPYRYRYGVLLDMVGDRNLELYVEKNSATWKDTRPVVESLWGVARDLGVQEFIPRTRHRVSDDHLALRNIAKIPTCDVIDLDYPSANLRTNYWHTTHDTPDKCSALSLAKVGWVMQEWLRRFP